MIFLLNKLQQDQLAISLRIEGKKKGTAWIINYWSLIMINNKYVQQLTYEWMSGKYLFMKMIPDTGLGTVNSQKFIEWMNI